MDLIEFVPEHVQKAALEAFGTFVDKMASLRDKKVDGEPDASEDHEKIGTWFVDPYALLESHGMGYRSAPTGLTMETLRVASERNSIIAGIHALRTTQVASFARPQPDKYSVGSKVRLRGSRARVMTASERERAEFIERYVQNTGLEYNLERDSFTDFLKKVTRDLLTYDAGCWQNVYTYGNDHHSFLAVDGASIRLVDTKGRRGGPPAAEDLRRAVRYAQLVEGKVEREYVARELTYLVMHPRSSLKVNGYGFSPLEQLMTTITSHLWAEKYNSSIFSQGSTIKGILNLSGKINPAQLEMLRKQYQIMISGIQNAWKTPITNAQDLKFVPLQMTNRDMEFGLWIEYLVKIICAIYLVDPAELNFDLRGGVNQQPMFMSSNEAQQKVSKDRGLRPLLHLLEDGINRYIVWPIDERFEFAFVGIDAKTEEQNAELRTKQTQTYMTLNEARALEDLPARPDGDVVLNPVALGWAQLEITKQQMASEQQQAGAAAGPAGQGDEGPPTEEDRAFVQPPGAEEARGVQRLREFSEKVDLLEQEPGLAGNDWTADVHASDRRRDLRKSVRDAFDGVFIDVALD